MAMAMVMENVLKLALVMQFLTMGLPVAGVVFTHPVLGVAMAITLGMAAGMFFTLALAKAW
jgi:hypothetical protein